MRVAVSAARAEGVAVGGQDAQALKAAVPSLFQRVAGLRTCAPTFAAQPADASVEEFAKEFEHATGLEKYELEGRAKGVDVWEESWLNQAWGTEANPVVVPSEYEERIVGVPDPDDDSLVWWAVIEDGQPPKQIVEGGEFFVLKRLPSSGGHH